jgi:AcrR family transcriptional regulator
MPRPKQRTPQLRDRVLQAAVDMLAHDGLAGFTTRKVAEGAGTSTPAVYELFGDKAGLVREMFFEGFRMLYLRLDGRGTTGDPRADMVAVMLVLREFAQENPALARLMFSRPFAEFDPGPSERRAGSAVRELIVERVRGCIDAGVISGDPTDIAHVLLAAAQGMILQETAGWLGTSSASMDRRWDLAADVLVNGLSSARPTATRLGQKPVQRGCGLAGLIGQLAHEFRRWQAGGEREGLPGPQIHHVWVAGRPCRLA